MKTTHRMFISRNFSTVYTYKYTTHVPSIEQNPRPPSPTRRTDDGRATAHRHAHDVHHQRLRFHAPDRRRQQTRGRGEEIRRRPRRQGTHRLLVFIPSRSLESHQPPVATVRSPRRGESASTPRGADARRTRARERCETTDRFFSHPSRPRRDRGFACGGDARAASDVAS